MLLGALVACVAPGVAQGLPFLLPPVLLLLALLLRRYPGERTLLRLRARRFDRPAHHARAATAPRHEPPRALVPRGGQLIASSLAVRPPPMLRVAVLS